MVRKNNRDWLAFYKGDALSNTLGRSAKGRRAGRLLAIAWCDDPANTDVPELLRFDCERTKEKDITKRAVSIGGKTCLFLGANAARVPVLTDTMRLTEVLKDQESKQTVAELLLPAAAAGRSLFVFLAPARWVCSAGHKLRVFFQVPLVLCFPRREVPVHIEISLVPHGCLWSSFELVALPSILVRVSRSTRLPAPPPPPPRPRPEPKPREPISRVATESCLSLAATEQLEEPLADTYDYEDVVFATPPESEGPPAWDDDVYYALGDLPLPPMDPMDVEDIDRYLV
jgi:hypothetical protein